MFALIASRGTEIVSNEISAMAQALRGGGKSRFWYDGRESAGAAGTALGILAEDDYCEQPFVAADRVFVGQARLDNRTELSETLISSPSDRATSSDCDILYLAYQKWRERCVDHAYGDYAFCVLDRRTRDVVAMVSHSGAARLYYSVNNGRLIIAAQLGAMLAHPSVSRELDITALGLLVASKIPPASTPYRNIHSLPGGYALSCRYGEAPQIWRWWQPETSVRTRYADPRDYVRHASEVFAVAVRTRLRSRTGLAATLSGGLDSTLVTAAAAAALRERGATLDAFTSVPEPGLACAMREGWDNDDFPYAAAVAAMHDNISHVAVTPRGRCLLDILPDLHARSHTPLRNGPNHLWLESVAQIMADRGAKVLLMGDRGNATVSATGDGAFRESLLLWQFRTSIWLATEKLREAGGAALRSMVREMTPALARRLVGADVQETLRPPADGFLAGSFISAVVEVREPWPRLRGRAGFARFGTTPRKPWAVDPIAQWGIEFRDPTDDRRLTELLLSFPLDAFIVKGRSRGLAREMGKGLVPDLVRLRKTRGAQVPEQAAIIAAHAPAYRRAVANIAAVRLCGSVLDVERLATAVEKIAENPLGEQEPYIVDRAIDVGLFIAGNSNENSSGGYTENLTG